MPKDPSTVKRREGFDESDTDENFSLQQAFAIL